MDLNNIVIYTERLKILPNIDDKYAEEIFNELTPKIATYLSFDPTGKLQDTINFIHQSQKAVSEGRDLPLIVFDKNSGEFIGGSGIHKIQTKTPEVGIWIKESKHQMGYGKEIIKSLIEWIRENMDFEYINYPVAKVNTPSRKLIESLGGVLCESKIFTSPTGKILDEVEYRIFK